MGGGGLKLHSLGSQFRGEETAPFSGRWGKKLRGQRGISKLKGTGLIESVLHLCYMKGGTLLYLSRVAWKEGSPLGVLFPITTLR